MKLRTACSSLNHHLFLNNVVDSPNCSCHQGVPETNSHYLFYCHRFNDSRNRYIESIDIPMNLTVDRLLVDHLTSQTIKIAVYFQMYKSL